MHAPTPKPETRLATVHALVPSGVKPADDTAILSALHDGDPHAPLRLFDRFAPSVERTLLRLLGSTSDLPDLLNEVFTRALQRVDRVVDPEALGMWLTRIAVFTAREHLRARRRRRWLLFLRVEELPAVETRGATPEMREAVRHLYRALDQLPVDERLAFTLRYVEQLELAEVALASGVSLATAKRRLARAQTRFVTLSRRDPVLADWLEGGGRWSEA